ncbi:hypothetical protein [Streptomyces sp. NPDC019937]|uniref:hypothetical protein n=1 Tax=Streptomyces sp. NPDC019937 TaxID=3154787 RepID=UPI0033D6B435
MPVALLPPITGSHGPTDAEPLTEGPRFVRTRAMTRWHRVRSGIRYTNGRLVYNLWCTGHVQGATFLSCDTPPASEPVCGLCDGKAVGAGQEPDGPPGRQLLFSPRHINPPKNCPGSRTDMTEELPGGRAGRCLACSDTLPLRAMGGPYNPRWAIVQHPPGPGLVPPCPFHRWRQLTARAGTVVCSCGRDLTS